MQQVAQASTAVGISQRPAPYVSVLIPARNEIATIDLVVAKVDRALQELDVSGELIVIDDGSTDGTGERAQALQARYPFLQVIRHRRGLGLTAALRAGFEAARGEIVVFLPADLESDPETDIPLLLRKLEEGYDVVAGWRQGRRDRKVVASAIYNWTCRRLFGVQAHDMNWIKAFRREVIEALPPLRSDWHRFLLMIAAHQGFRVGEVPTPYHPRRAGKSKFGIGRIPISLLDLLVVWFLLTFSRAPMRFFGGLGLAALTASGLIFTYLAYLWFAFETQKRPIFWLAGGLAIAGLLLILIGFVAELIVSQEERIVRLEEMLKQQQRSDS
ncbi:MAG TPA: glycosyltransferase family 2 protein [Caldilineae bacterium]|nr:glycosyltransferase family 2 protein [Caldilineae bacterium]